jgi:hypothetical protein
MLPTPAVARKEPRRSVRRGGAEVLGEGPGRDGRPGPGGDYLKNIAWASSTDRVEVTDQ